MRAADALVGRCMRKKQYEEAEKYLEYFSVQNPERKRKQAQIYAETGRIREACKAYEELLFSDYQRASMELHGLYLLALQNQDGARARMLADKQKELAQCFEMGNTMRFPPAGSCDAGKGCRSGGIHNGRDAFLRGTDRRFPKSPLYEHMEFKEISEEFVAELKENLLKCFRDEEICGFLKNNERWKRLVNQ